MQKFIEDEPRKKMELRELNDVFQNCFSEREENKVKYVFLLALRIILWRKGKER